MSLHDDLRRAERPRYVAEEWEDADDRALTPEEWEGPVLVVALVVAAVVILALVGWQLVKAVSA